MMAFFSGPLAIPCIILLVVGIALLLVEMLLPGFGVPGVCGILCLIASVTMQFIGNSIKGALVFTACVTVLVLLLLIIFLRSFRKGKLSHSAFVNASAVKEEAVPVSAAEPAAVTVGMRGKALTALRPAGIVEINGKRVNAETEGTFVSAGKEVKVTEVKGLGIIVHEIL